MKSRAWRNKIKTCCENAGTYQPFFDPVINTLADILERRDDAQQMFEKSGKKILVKHTNKGGATNIEQNPLVRLINDLNRDSLSYWRELGLTSRSYKQMTGTLEVKSDSVSLEKALADLGI